MSGETKGSGIFLCLCARKTYKDLPVFSTWGKQRGRESFLPERAKNLLGPSGFLDTRFEQPPAAIQNDPVSFP